MILEGVAAVIASIGGVIVGTTGLVSAISARRSARLATESAARVLEASPAAIEAEMRREIEELSGAFQASILRHAQERDGMEAALDHERARAETAESEVFQLRALMAGLRLDLASARAELSDLRGRFEEFISSR